MYKQALPSFAMEQRQKERDGRKREESNKLCLKIGSNNGEIASDPRDRCTSFGAARNDSWLFSHSPQHVCFYPTSLKKKRICLSTKRGGRATVKVTDTEAMNRKESNQPQPRIRLEERVDQAWGNFQKHKKLNYCRGHKHRGLTFLYHWLGECKDGPIWFKFWPLLGWNKCKPQICLCWNLPDSCGFLVRRWRPLAPSRWDWWSEPLVHRWHRWHEPTW